MHQLASALKVGYEQQSRWRSILFFVKTRTASVRITTSTFVVNDGSDRHYANYDVNDDHMISIVVVMVVVVMGTVMVMVMVLP